jgi:hypothetical protein
MRMLADLMQWKDERLTAELPWLRLMVNYKYDHYQGYGPGSRFCVNLIYWLSQFSTLEDRETAFKFIRTRVIYISSREMLHLVGLSMPEIKRAMRRSVGSALKIRTHQTWGHKDANHRLAKMSERTLYVGLSDGAKIDSFRRYNEGVVSNEQIIASPEITEKKWRGLVKDLRVRLDKKGWTDVEAKFERVCLIDDFTASGSTLIRQEKDLSWSGKIPRFCEQNFADDFNPLTSNCVMHAHHYIATSKAKEIVTDAVNLFSSQSSYFFELTFSTVLDNSIVVSDSYDDSNFASLIKRHYDHGIEDVHTKEDIWYGYKQCGLPLVLDHNTPNNSVALLWATTELEKLNGKEMHPLFPRIKRHSEYGQSI